MRLRALATACVAGWIGIAAFVTVVALAVYVVLAIRDAGARLGHAAAAVLCATMLAGPAGAWLVVLPRAEAAQRTRGGAGAGGAQARSPA